MTSMLVSSCQKDPAIKKDADSNCIECNSQLECLSECVPNCIKNKIKEINRSSDTSNFLDAVYQYDYQCQTVFYFVPKRYPDACHRLLDYNCNELKDSEGKIICDCIWGEPKNCYCFKRNRTNKRVIWTD